jgi:hypothetical protein
MSQEAPLVVKLGVILCSLSQLLGRFRARLTSSAMVAENGASFEANSRVMNVCGLLGFSSFDMDW